jgi:ankyrin repeat protein
MKKILVVAFTLTFFVLKAQQRNTLLDQAFWKNNPDIEAVKAEIAKGNSPSELNPMVFDATCMAINNGASNAVIKFLLEQDGNSVKKLTHDERTYLHWAAMRGNVEISEYLIAKGSDINLEDIQGNTPLIFAANGGQTNVALYEAFFKAGLDPKKKYNDGANLLLICIANDKDLTLTNYLTTKGLSLNDVDNNGNTAFNYAARTGNIAQLKSLLQKGVKYTPNALLIAAQGSRRSANTIEVYKYLVEELKIKPTSTDKNGETVLHSLVRKPNQTEIINYFLEKGVDINKANNDGNTAFMNAASGRELAVLEQLLPKVKNINAVNNKGESALTLAIRSSSADVVSFLIKNGADINLKDKEGNTLAYYLIQSYRPQGRGPGGGEGFGGGRGQDDFGTKMKLLQEKGLNFSALQKDGNTLYHIAIAKNDLNLLKNLASLNIDINIKNKEGLTVLHKAAMLAKDDVILKYLLSVGAKKEIATEFNETAYTLAKENEFLTKKNISLDFLK